MKVTRDVVTDLLPLFYSKECSADTTLLVNEFLSTHPDFAEQAKQVSHNPLPDVPSYRLGKEVELTSLIRTRRLLRLRSYLMGFAIFFSLLPFSFMVIKGEFRWLFAASPLSALAYLICGLAFWIGYAVTKHNTNDL